MQEHDFLTRLASLNRALISDWRCPRPNESQKRNATEPADAASANGARVECVAEVPSKPSPFDTRELVVEIVTSPSARITLSPEGSGPSDKTFRFKDGDIRIAKVRNLMALENQPPYFRLVLNDAAYERLMDGGIISPRIPLELRVEHLLVPVEASFAHAEGDSGVADSQGHELKLQFKNRRLGIEQREVVDEVLGQLAWSGAPPASVEQRKTLSPRYPAWLGAALLKVISVASVFLLIITLVRRRPSVAALSAMLSAYSLGLSVHLLSLNPSLIRFIRFSHLSIEEVFWFGVASVVAAASLLNFRRENMSPIRAFAGSTCLFGVVILLSFVNRSQGVSPTLWTLTIVPLLVSALHIPFVHKRAAVQELKA